MKINRPARIVFLLLAAAMALLLCGCADIQRFFAPSYDVVYYVDDIELSRQSVKENEFPVDPELPQTDGLKFWHWADASGAKAEPSAVAVTGECAYHAVRMPELTEHVSYVFTDDNGFIRPDDALTMDELSAALDALGADSAKAYYPILPSGQDAVTADLLREVLKSFYTEEYLNPALNDMAGDNHVTRARFCVIMNTLLGRSGESVTPNEGSFAIPDLPITRADYADVCEAAVSHAPGGAIWEEVSLEPMYAEGFLPLNGFLYYVDAGGRFIYDSDVGTLHFGSDGRFTSGDEKLDSLVRPVLAEIYAADPGADRFDMMKTAYYYCRDTFQYLRRNYYNMGDTGWELQEAITMLDTHRGNCYNYASAFWALARGLGYEARTVSGTITVTNQPHGWVMIPIDGEEYYFDPEMEMTYIRDKRPVKNMFMMNRFYAAGWTYRGN